MSAVLVTCQLQVWAQQLRGVVIDKSTKETLIGALVSVEGCEAKSITDLDGNFTIAGIKKGTYTLCVKYMGYKPLRKENVKADTDTTKTLTLEMEPDEQMLKSVNITAVERKNSNTAMIKELKNSSFVVSNVSAQEIGRTQDTNAGEVIRRVSGVSLIEDKFVMVRGLSQRYNNVWINGGAVPSSEADSRAFSFDMIPSAQIENLTIVKSTAAQYPADYSGGFIIVNTKEIPSENEASVSVGSNWNTSSAFSDFLYAKGSSTDFLGFDNGMRSVNKMRNDWKVKEKTPLGDLKLSANVNRRWNTDKGLCGLLAAVNYTNEFRTYEDMQNNLFGIYDATKGQSNYLRYSMDNQYNNNVRLGAMLNLTMLSKDGKHKLQLKNIFNQLATSRYTWREGMDAQSNMENSAEYYYRSRTTYNGQVTGKHTFTNDVLDWSAGYAYANRRLPDRRRYLLNDIEETGIIALHTGNDISREWTKLNEHIFSAGVNEKHQLHFGDWKPSLQVGAYGEYRTRQYDTKYFFYQWNPSDNTLPSDFQHSDITALLSDDANIGVDRLSIIEQMQKRNDYRGHNVLGAGYLSAYIPLGKVDINGGVRFEHNDMTLFSNTRDYEKSEQSRHYRTDDFFPSVNCTYHLNDLHQIRLSYGRSTNRAEFREVSPSVFYDFDLASDVQGNTELENCYIDNMDLRYEWYPSKGEVVSVAAFYKHFNSPIEWTYTVAGGTNLIYSYKNALSADNYGLELDIRKDLGFMGLPHFSWSFNGALIKSKVKFEKGAKEENRPMQGQSPYLINTGFFYKNERWMLDVALLYNRIGKRIIGVGRSEGSSASDDNARVPHSYEMPRDVLDLSVAKRWGTHWEVKFNVRDILAEKVYYKQFAEVKYTDGRHSTVEEVTRCYRPGVNIGLQAIYKF